MLQTAHLCGLVILGLAASTGNTAIAVIAVIEVTANAVMTVIAVPWKSVETRGNPWKANSGKNCSAAITGIEKPCVFPRFGSGNVAANACHQLDTSGNPWKSVNNSVLPQLPQLRLPQLPQLRK